jgi:hypothetical protein
VRATSGFIRLFIRGLAWDATEAQGLFVDTLKAASRAKLIKVGGATFLSLVSQGGAEVRYTLPPTDELTQGDIAEVCSALLDRVDAIKAADSSIADSALVTALLAAFPAPPPPRSVRMLRPDFSFGLHRA